MSGTPDFDRAYKFSFEQFEKHNRDKSKLSIELQTIITITTAQGIIDNGGLVFFFEQDFEDQPPYESFAQAYDAIGASDAARILREVVASFPFADPQLSQDKRQECMENWREEGGIEIDLLWPWDSQAVWQMADRYAKENRDIFEIA